MKTFAWLVLSVLFIPFAIAGCKGNEGKSPADKEHPIKGKVVAVNPDKSSVKLDHEDIPGLMQGMEMDFAVEKPKLLEGLKPGDQVQGRLKVESGKYTITALEKR
jgi:Cu/Ag efflux protein CusF